MPDRDTKTNAMRVLEGRKIPYVAHFYSEGRHSAEEVAAELGLPASQVFKTLVVMPADGPGRPLLAIVPGDRELALKKLAQATRAKKLRMATQKEAESLTGLLVGGISALALLAKHWKVYLDSSSSAYPEILVSAGQRGINLQLAVADLIKVTEAQVADLSHALDETE
jgi:Cys-tRNA(Pro)/Cys-tRNA(Cys) deacylase